MTDSIINKWPVKIDRAYIYCRVSDPEQSNETKQKSSQDRESINNQIQTCIDICQKNGWSYQDEDIYHDVQTGTDFDRKELNELRDKARSNSVIVIYKIDRLGRNARVFLNFLHDLRKRKVYVYSATQDLHNITSQHKLTLLILAGVAEQESDHTSDRVKRGMKYLKDEKGQFLAGEHKTPFGYNYCEKHLTINDDEFIIIEEIFRMKDEKKSLKQIMNILNDRNDLKRGQYWTLNMLRKIVYHRNNYFGDKSYQIIYKPR